MLQSMPCCSHALTELRQPPRIPTEALSALGQRGWCVVPDWLGPDAVAALRRDMQLCDEEGLPRSASIGSTRTGPTAAREDTQIRLSRMLPLYPPPRPSAGHIDTRMALAEAVRGLGSQLEQAEQLEDVPPLAPFHTELAYLYYPVGGMYKRHVDVPFARDGWNPMGRRPEDGGSFSGSATRREISMLLYLDSGWETDWGGELRIFEPDAHADQEDSAERTVDVLPQGGTLVLMRSRRVAHEVLATRRERNCLVGWFRTVGVYVPV